MTAARESGDRAVPSHAVGGTVVLPVQLVRVQRLLLLRELVESAPAALTLLVTGVGGLRTAVAATADRALAAAEIASSAWMLLLLRRAVRETLGRARPHEAPTAVTAEHATADSLPADERLDGVEWSGVAGATMLGVGSWQHWHATGRVQRPVALLALVTLYLATGGRRTIARVMRRRIGDRRPRLVISADGLDYRASRRRRWVARWDDVASVTHDAESVRVALRDGRVREIRARDHVDGSRLVAATRAALATLLPARLVPGDEARLSPSGPAAALGAPPEGR